MSFTPENTGIVSSAGNLLSSAWGKLQGAFGHIARHDFVPEQSLALVPNIDPRFIPRVPMSNANLDLGLLTKLSNEGYKRGKEITAETHPELYHLWTAMCARAGLNRVPQLILAESKVPNAVSITEENAVMVSTSLLKKLDLREVSAVLGHELGHESSNHTTPRIAALTLLGGAGAILGDNFANNGGFGSLIKQVESPGPVRRVSHWLLGNGTQRLGFLAYAAYVLTGGFLGSIAANQISVRPTELDADRKGAAISGDPEGLISALAKLEDGRKNGFLQTLRMVESGYPSTQTRIARLREISAGMPNAQPVIAAIEAPPSLQTAMAPHPQVHAVSQAERIVAPVQAPSL
jgi:heat shock protein HtpX